MTGLHTPEKSGYTGYVGVIGRPNVGKSSIVNRIIGKPISIVTKKKQTTRRTIHGILNLFDSQIIFLDNPGIDFNSKFLINKYLNKQALSGLQGLDVILFVLEAREFTNDDKKILGVLPRNVPLFILFNKIDLVRDEVKRKGVYERVEFLKKYNPQAIIPVSAKRNYQLDTLIPLVKKHLKWDCFQFGTATETAHDKKFISSEIIRKNIMNSVGDELHYGIAVEVDSINSLKSNRNMLFIRATIHVSKTNHKPMVIGLGGKKLSFIRRQSMYELKNFFDKKVTLSLWVKVSLKWERNILKLGSIT